jgi:ketosteroid isomerase-like protein
MGPVRVLGRMIDTLPDTPAVALMRRYVACARSGDFTGAYGFFADDIDLRIPGRSAMAGAFRGRQVAIDYIERARALSHGEDVEVEVIEMLAGGDRVALLVRERFHRPDGPVDIHRANVYTVRDGAIVAIAIFEGDQYAVDALLAG